MNMFERKPKTQTNGELIVERALSGEHGVGEYLLTPEDCRLILDVCDFNQPVAHDDGPESNRKINAKRANQYARQFEKEVIDTGDTLKFDTNGNLFDGRHRLTAIINSGVEFYTIIAFGRSTKAFAVVDSMVSTRTKSEVFAMAGIKNGGQISSAIPHLMFYSRGVVKGVNRSVPADELLQYHHDKIDADLLQRCAAASDKVYRAAKLSRIALTVVSYVVAQNGNREKMFDFLEGVAEGERAGKFNVVGLLLKHLLAFEILPGVSITTRRHVELVAYVWGIYARGQRGSKSALENTKIAEIYLGK